MSTPRVSVRQAALSAFLLVLAITPQVRPADQLPTSAHPEIVELPTLEVTDTPKLPRPDKWRYTQIPGFEVISNGSDSETLRLLRNFETFRIALDVAWPMKKFPAPPSALILCGKETTFDAFVAKEKIGPDRASPTLLLTTSEQSFILVDLALKKVVTSAFTADVSSGQTDLQYEIAGFRTTARSGGGTGSSPLISNAIFKIDPHIQLYREYVRYIFAQDPTPPPVWLEEGIAQIVMRMQFTPRSILIGQLIENPSSSPSAQSFEDRDFIEALRRRKLLSFDDFFGVQRGSAVIEESVIGTDLWAKQAYAFVHLGLYGQLGRYKPAFEALVARAQKGPVTPAIFEECYGKPYEKFLVELAAYIESPNYEYQEHTIKGKDRLDASPPDLRDATESESERIKGDALRAAGKTASARETAVAAYIRGERDPQFLATLGQIELAVGHNQRAEKLLAVAAPTTTRPSVLIDLAQLRYDSATASNVGTDKKITDAQAATILQPLLAARALQPSTPEVYSLMARIWAQTKTSPTAENVAMVTEGLKRFPRDEALVYYTAALNLRLGRHEAARSLIAYGEKIVVNDTQRSQFTRLKAQLPSDSSTLAR
ncbi:MAG: hypothetical protein QM760_00645 [Nibricoccus sp.]